MRREGGTTATSWLNASATAARRFSLLLPCVVVCSSSSNQQQQSASQYMAHGHATMAPICFKSSHVLLLLLLLQAQECTAIC
jgi:hypothetical protein